MMLKPSIDKLLEKIDSKYTLVVLEGKRAHELREMKKEDRDRMGFTSLKPNQQALEEIASGKVTIHPSAEVKRETLVEKHELLHLYELDREQRIRDMIAREQEEEEAKINGVKHVDEEEEV